MKTYKVTFHGFHLANFRCETEAEAYMLYHRMTEANKGTEGFRIEETWEEEQTPIPTFTDGDADRIAEKMMKTLDIQAAV